MGGNGPILTPYVSSGLLNQTNDRYESYLEAHPTVDAWNLAPPGMYETLKNNGINYQPQLVSRILPSTVGLVSS